MLTSTYVHVSGIGYGTEQRLWRAGALSWEELLRRPPDVGVGAGRMATLLDRVEASRQALAARDHRFFSGCLARRDQWRAVPEFADRILYLDIETTGGDEVTVIGIHDGTRLRQFVRGENLLEAEEVLAEAALLVTFFGTGFDVPVLRELFPRLPFDALHVDLCHTLRRLELSGGLKAIERQLGIARAPEIAGLGGWDAVRLWYAHLQGSEEAREVLLRYNRADVENMIPLLEFAYRAMREKTLAAVEQSLTRAPLPAAARRGG